MGGPGASGVGGACPWTKNLGSVWFLWSSRVIVSHMPELLQGHVLVSHSINILGDMGRPGLWNLGLILQRLKGEWDFPAGIKVER